MIFKSLTKKSNVKFSEEKTMLYQGCDVTLSGASSQGVSPDRGRNLGDHLFPI